MESPKDKIEREMVEGSVTIPLSRYEYLKSCEANWQRLQDAKEKDERLICEKFGIKTGKVVGVVRVPEMSVSLKTLLDSMSNNIPDIYDIIDKMSFAELWKIKHGKQSKI